MLKYTTIFLILIVLATSCTDKKTSQKDDQLASATFDSILDNYYEDGLKLNPISATTSGDMRYNDQFPDFLSESYRDSLKSYYERYQDAAEDIDDSALSETEQLSKEILLWECELNLETLTFDNMTIRN